MPSGARLRAVDRGRSGRLHDTEVYGAYSVWLLMTERSMISIVVPLFNEEATVEPLYIAVASAMRGTPDWELILVDDGSTDDTVSELARMAVRDVRVRPLILRRNYGQTAAMQAGFDNARGDVVVSMDGDLQNDPADIPRLLRTLNEGYDLVAGYRRSRRDRMLSRKLPSWVANRIIMWITGIPIRDNGCSLKAYRREVIDRLHLYSDMHRFIPALAATMAGARIAEVSVRHHPRRFGQSKYGLSRVGKVLADLLTLKMVRGFRERPLAMFGLGAIGALAAGVLWLLVVVTAPDADPIGRETIMVPSGIILLWLGLAVYLIMLGLIGEVVVHEQMRRKAGLPRPIIRELQT